MTEFLVRHFVKDYEHVEKMSIRTAYGVLASIVGIFVMYFVCGEICEGRAGRAQRVGCHGGCVQ